MAAPARPAAPAAGDKEATAALHSDAKALAGDARPAAAVTRAGATPTEPAGTVVAREPQGEQRAAAPEGGEQDALAELRAASRREAPTADAPETAREPGAASAPQADDEPAVRAHAVSPSIGFSAPSDRAPWLKASAQGARAAADELIAAFNRANPQLLQTHVQVPVSSLFGAGGALILMVVAAFFVGRCSVSGTRGIPLAVRGALGAAQGAARSAVPAPPKQCWVSRQPRRWAATVAKTIPFDVTAIGPTLFAIGYASSPTDAVGVVVDAANGEISTRFSQAESATIASVTPDKNDKFMVTTEEPSGLRSAFHVAGPEPFMVGLAGGAIAAADAPDAQPAPLWNVEGDEPLEAPRAVALDAQGYAIAFRREKAVWVGSIGRDRKAKGELTRVTGSGGAVGKPSLGWNGKEMAVVFADRPTDRGRWEIRAGRAPSGSALTTTSVIPLPDGGPGGDAFAPDIAGLPDGRWVLVWTEGPPGRRAMRAQTLGPDFSRVGDPIALSPPAGNFGQGILAVSSSYVSVVFLSKPAASYELWGVILQCG